MMRKSSVFSMMVFALLKMPSAIVNAAGNPAKDSDSYTNPWLRKLALAHICNMSHPKLKDFATDTCTCVRCKCYTEKGGFLN